MACAPETLISFLCVKRTGNCLEVYTLYISLLLLLFLLITLMETPFNANQKKAAIAILISIKQTSEQQRLSRTESDIT